MPNVVFLMSDSHNPFVTSVYGHPFVRTPNLERLAERGTVFENAYTPSPLCVPARSCLMSGMYVHQNEVFNNCKVIPAGHPTYGGVLAEQGVHTVYIGPGANLYNDPFTFGFTEMIGVKRTEPNLSTRFDRSVPPKEHGRPINKKHGPKDDVWQGDIDSVESAVRWLRERASQLDKPWTLTVNVVAPHPPFYARPEYWRMYEGYGDLPEYGDDVEPARHPYAQDLRDYILTGGLTEQEIRGMRQGYYAGVTFVDAQLGLLLDALEETGQLENTVVAYVSDHGEMLGKFGLWWKRTMYEDSVRIPLVVAGPGFAAGRRVRTPVSLLDFQATIFQAVGAQRPDGWQGTPLQHVAENDPERVVFSEYHGDGIRAGSFMVRKGDWKLIYNMAAPHQLFNLAEDPDELHNVYAKEPEVAADLEQELRRICDPEAVNERAFAKEREQLAAIARMKEAEA